MKGNLEKYKERCFTALRTLFPQSPQSLADEYEKLYKKENWAILGKRPFETSTHNDQSVRPPLKRRKVQAAPNHTLEGMVTRLGASIKVWRKGFDNFLGFAPSDHPYREKAIDGISRCEKLRKRLDDGDVERVHESEKAEYIYQILTTEMVRLQNKEKRMGSLKPQGFPGLIQAFKDIPKGQRPKSELVVPDVCNFLHRTQPSKDGTFKVVQKMVLDSVCPVNPRTIWSDWQQLSETHKYDSD